MESPVTKKLSGIRRLFVMRKFMLQRYYIIFVKIVNSGKVVYKTGFLYTKWESRLQKEIVIYKTGVLKYKWESRIAIYLLGLLFTVLCRFLMHMY